MKNIKFYILLTIQCIWLSNSIAQSFTFEPMPYNDQLPSYSVQHMCQDSEGFMWFGTTDGLSRYDGYRLLSFRSDLNNRMLLSNNEIKFIAEDVNNRLFIGTQRGLCYLDKTTYEIKNLLDLPIGAESVRYIKCMQNGDIWVGFNNKLIKLNSTLDNYTDYTSKSGIAQINSIYEDRKGNLWITSWQNGLSKYHPEDDSFKRYPQIGRLDNPFTIFQDEQERYWIGTWGEGLYMFNPDADDMYTPISSYNKIERKSEDTFFGIVQDNVFGYLWAVGLTGLFVFDISSEIPRLKEDISIKNESNNVFCGILKDIEGNLWIGTFNEGVYMIDVKNPPIINYPLSEIKNLSGFTPNINMMYIDYEGDIWFNQINWKMGIYSPQNEKVFSYLDHSLLRDMGMIHSIRHWSLDPKEIWIGVETQEAIYCLNKKGKDIQLKKKINLCDIRANAGIAHLMFEDSKYNKWIVAVNALIIQYANQETFVSVDYDFGVVSGIAEDNEKHIWISSSEGLFRIDISVQDERNSPEIVKADNKSHIYSENITAIGVDKSGDLWIGTQEGYIFRHHILTGTYTDMSTEIRILGEHIQDIIPDDLGHLWFVTNKRIMEYNPSNGACREYSARDGVLVNSFRRNSWVKDQDGKLYIGGNKGISVFTPSEELASLPQNRVAFVTEVMVNNKSVYSKNGDKFNLGKQILTLQPHEKNVELHFSALRYSNPLNIRFAYKMEGIDKDWVYPDENRQFAVYNQLTKGEHIFYIKASDENRLWNEHTTVFKIYKYPEWYESNLAYTIYVVFLGSLLFIVYYFIRNRIYLQNSLRFARIEKEKTEELTQMKLRYFTNVSHDLLTPLTIMSCLMDDIQMAYPGKSERFSAMRYNLSLLKKLLQQVLDFRKIENDKMKLHLSEGNIVAFIEQIGYNYFIPLMKKKNIRFNLKAENKKIICYFDADKIEKIIFNLLSNSYKYTQVNGEVDLRIMHGPEEEIIIQVWDNGKGIDKAEQEHIFNRFYSNKWEENRDTNGIGLSVVKEMIEMHHGNIEVASEINAGTVFTIRLPLGENGYSKSDLNEVYTLPLNDISIAENSFIEEIKKEQTLIPLYTASVLIVEDNEELLELMAGILKKDYLVVTARNGWEAMQVIEQEDVNVDLIISDVMMPEMNGLEFCGSIKSHLETSHIPVILLTARSTPEDRIECYKAGANGYISKPFELNVLKARIHNFLMEKTFKQQQFIIDKHINLSTLSCQSLDEQFLKKTVTIIEKHLSDSELDVESIARELNLSKTTFYRKIKTVTGLPPSDFIRNVQLKHACHMLSDPNINVSEVAYSVGFSDPKYFTRCFKKAFNMSPSEYQNSREQEQHFAKSQNKEE